MAKIKKTQMRDSHDSLFGEHVSDGIFWVQKICEVLQAHFIVIRPSRSIFVIRRILSIHGMSPTLKKNKGATLRMTLEVFQFVVNTSPPGLRRAPSQGLQPLSAGGAPHSVAQPAACPSPAQDCPLHGSCSPRVHSVFPWRPVGHLEHIPCTWTWGEWAKMSHSVVKIEVIF